MTWVLVLGKTPDLPLQTQLSQSQCTQLWLSSLSVGFWSRPRQREKSMLQLRLGLTRLQSQLQLPPMFSFRSRCSPVFPRYIFLATLPLRYPRLCITSASPQSTASVWRYFRPVVRDMFTIHLLLLASLTTEWSMRASSMWVGVDCALSITVCEPGTPLGVFWACLAVRLSSRGRLGLVKTLRMSHTILGLVLRTGLYCPTEGVGSILYFFSRWSLDSCLLNADEFLVGLLMVGVGFCTLRFLEGVEGWLGLSLAAWLRAALLKRPTPVGSVWSRIMLGYIFYFKKSLVRVVAPNEDPQQAHRQLLMVAL